MRLTFAMSAIAMLAFATNAEAQDWSNNYNHQRTSRQYGYNQGYTRQGYARRYGYPGGMHRSNNGSDCPNGDCRGVNSPGILGGAPGNF